MQRLQPLQNGQFGSKIKKCQKHAKSRSTRTLEMLYEVRCLKSNKDMILALTGQFKQLSHEPEKFFRFVRQLLKLSSKCEDHILI